MSSIDTSYNPLPGTERASAESPPSSGWAYAPGTAETKPHPAYKETPLARTSWQQQQPWATSLLGWLPELLWCAVSVASVAALAGVLSRFDNQPLPRWPLGLTLNTLIAFLATLARASFIIPVSESVSQLKWLWYRDAPRPLKDFQDFDAASRGAWGSLQLLKTTRGWSPSVISMVVLVSAIFTSTLTQSVVTYPVRLTPVEGTAVVSRSTSFYFSTANVFAGGKAHLLRLDGLLSLTRLLPVTQQHYTQQSIFEGLSYSHTQEFPLSPARCPTSECRWDAYSSLSVCAKFWNVTDSLNVTVKKRPTPPSSVLAELPNGVSANLTGNYQGMVVLRGTSRPIASDVHPEASLLNFTVLYSLRNSPTERVGAAEAVLYLCAKTYDLAFVDNVESRTVAGVTTDVELGSVALPGTEMRRELPAIRDPLGAGNFPFGGTGLAAVTESLAYALNGSYADLSGDPSALGLAPARYLAALQYGAETLESQGRPNVSQETVINESIANITNNIARSLSNRITKDAATNITGEALAAETFVQVRWPWLAFISSQVALSIVLLATAIVGTKRAGLGVVKSCTLQAFVAINSKDKQALEISLAQQRHQREVDSIVERGLGIAWRLGMTDHGWKLGL
ncbi:hypothetical protein CGRA01v4_05954 [Colletotrichum graminicola]|uniref:Uncharacterized protein n=1 Tax=Colletotrichum graminicola (strain M1.001 / M2 / FGSC 10212) TaxID=645133 RepID=E3QNN1_COLGM|nr:uncharacterized protein GLRG_07788 [Colletotrichum graminicola M1.001]EFQ32518.1 hypothetical protein GLRG_07788 [Colletotrichum graminicola M1.001]WDK14673.1 hypothetical protein CGRA01v4_05954 [Colletotrichum graminicola]